MDKNIKFLSQYFYPEPGATSELLSEVATGLSRVGYTVQCLAGQPSYFESSRLPRVIDHKGVKVRRVWSTTLDKNSAVGRILNTLTFTLSSFWNILFTPRDTVLVAVTNPPLLPWVCLAGHILRGHRFVLVLHDLYPDIAVKLGVLRGNSFVVWLWTRLNDFALGKAERIIVLGRDMQKAVVSRAAVAVKDKVVIIPNWANGREITPLERDNHKLLNKLGVQGRFVIQYSGNIGRFHEIETILDAAGQLEKKDFFIMFIGTGAQVDSVVAKIDEWGESYIRLLPFRPREQLGESLTACDVALVTLRDGLSGLAVPSKLYGVLAAGKPVVVVAPDDCEAALVIKEYKCGIVVHPGDDDGLVVALRELKNNQPRCNEMGKNARKAFEENYDLPLVVQRWVNMLEHLD